MDDLPPVESVETILAGLQATFPDIVIDRFMDYGFTIWAEIPGKSGKIAIKQMLRPERDGVSGSWQIPTLAAAIEALNKLPARS